MKKKAKGFTVIELIIASAILLIVLGVIYNILKVNNGMLSEVDIKSTLQIDGETIQRDISKVGMQSTGITDCVTGSGINQYGSQYIVDMTYDEFNTRQNADKISQIKFNYVTESGNETYTVKYDEANRTLTGLRGDAARAKTLSTNVESFKINTVDNQNNTLRSCTYVQFDILLKKKVGVTQAEYPVSILVKFRNKN